MPWRIALDLPVEERQTVLFLTKIVGDWCRAAGVGPQGCQVRYRLLGQLAHMLFIDPRNLDSSLAIRS